MTVSNYSKVRIGVDSLFEANQKLWSHLICDDFSESGLLILHTFAREIGAPDIAFHEPKGQLSPHYDLTPELREKALAAGAEHLDRRSLVDFLKRGRERAEEADPADLEPAWTDDSELTQEELTIYLENEWDPEFGFFGKLKFEQFDLEGYRRVESLLKKLDPAAKSLNRRLVSVSWFIPLFMSWQKSHGLEESEYLNYCNRLEQLVIEGLGIP